MVVEKTVSIDVARPVSFTPAPKNQADNRQLSLLDALDATDAAEHSTDTVDRETTANALYNHLYEDCNSV